MSFLRRTSTYLVLVPLRGQDPHTLLDQMVERCTAEVNSSAVHPSGWAGVRFRCPTEDNVALNVALQIATGSEFRLSTSYGINQREVAQ